MEHKLKIQTVLIRLVILAILFSSSNGFAFDFDRELAKQNNLQVQVVDEPRESQAPQETNVKNDFQVVLLPTQRAYANRKPAGLPDRKPLRQEPVDFKCLAIDLNI